LDDEVAFKRGIGTRLDEMRQEARDGDFDPWSD
jgi:hypothetical protein